jgi:hypothetical protein
MGPYILVTTFPSLIIINLVGIISQTRKMVLEIRLCTIALMISIRIWVDQPVGTGFSTADSSGYINSEDQMGEDFLGFLRNLVQVFPSLAKRPLYLTGEVSSPNA